MAARWVDMLRPFLGNGSVNTFPQQQTRTQQWCSNKGTVSSAVLAAAVARKTR
jgi:hypothetical protein